MDVLSASIGLAHNATVVESSVKGFEDIGNV
jgi:hypothetical protein